MSANSTCSWDGGEEYSDLKASLHARIEAGKKITAYYDTADFDPNYQRGLEYMVIFSPNQIAGTHREDFICRFGFVE